MLVRVLGEVSLVDADGGVVVLPGTRQPALLAALVVRSGQVVSVERLVDLLFDDPPERPAAALHSVVFKLRASLDRLGCRDLLLTREHGYLLDLQPGEVDIDVFESLVERARDQASAEAAETLSEALRLWRGRPYGDLGDSDIAGLEVLRLEELQRVAVERYGVALLDSGQAAEAIAVMQPFVAEHALREQARIVLMRALHAEGRAAEALDQYQDYRRELAEELGLEPSSALVEAQLAVLRGPPSSTSRAVERPGQHHLAGMQVRYLRAGAGHTVAYTSIGSGPEGGRDPRLDLQPGRDRVGSRPPVVPPRAADRRPLDHPVRPGRHRPVTGARSRTTDWTRAWPSWRTSCAPSVPRCRCWPCLRRDRSP